MTVPARSRPLPRCARRTWLAPIISYLLLAATPHTIPAQGPPPVNGGTPVGSPDGRYIAFNSSRDGTPDLYVIAADGSGLRRLTNDPDREGIAGWTPDSREVLFVRTAPGPFVMAPVPRPVVAVDLSGRTREVGTIQGRGAAVSPDGRSIAYSGGQAMTSHLAVAQLNGTAPRILTDSTSGVAFNFTWSPDGRRIAFTRMPPPPGRELSIWITGADGSDARLAGQVPAEEGSAQWPAWSPSGKFLAAQVGKYDQADPSKSTAHLWLIDVATGAATKLNPHDRPWLDETPTWVGPGSIAFQSDRTGRMEIWITSLDGRPPRQLTR